MRFNTDREQDDSPARNRARDLRQRTNIAERKLWNLIKNRKLEGLKFRRQHPIGPYTADFYCAASKLIVELDGSAHDRDHDARRDAYMDSLGLRTLRISVSAFESNPTGALMLIQQAANHMTS